MSYFYGYKTTINSLPVPNIQHSPSLRHVFTPCWPQRWNPQVYNGLFEPPPPSLSQPPPSTPRSLLLGLYKQPGGQRHPSLSKDKGRIYQYVLVTFRGQCCCSWTPAAGSQKSTSVLPGYCVCLLWAKACRGECQLLGQMLRVCRGSRLGGGSRHERLLGDFLIKTTE